VFSENLTSVGAAHSMESIVWKTLTEWHDKSVDAEQFRSRWSERAKELKSLSVQIGVNAHTDAEKHTGEQLQKSQQIISEAIDTELNISRTTGERSEASGQRLRELSEALAAEALELRRINDELIGEARTRLAGAHAVALFARTLMLTFGPLLGLYLGWRVAHRLQTSVSQIAVTLSGSTSASGLTGSSHLMAQASSFDEVRQQAETVVERLRHVGLELQSAKEEVIQAERLAAVGELAAGVAHELRNPLTSVKLLLQHAARKPQAMNIGESQLQLILEEVGRMEGTIQGLLDFSRTPTLNRSCHDLRETLGRSMNLIDGRLRQAHIELLTEIDSDPILIDGDAEQLNQVFVNLLLNSIEAMENGGQLNVVASITPDGKRTFVSIADTGSGIAPEVMSRLFEPFATTKERGTGLGLAISHRIVVEHHGTILAENRNQRGAVFTVELPLSSLATTKPKERTSRNGKVAFD